jgi:hypothetical protein
MKQPSGCRRVLFVDPRVKSRAAPRSGRAISPWAGMIEGGLIRDEVKLVLTGFAFDLRQSAAGASPVNWAHANQ